MKHIFCWFRVHAWKRLTWGRALDLTCRKCTRCERFEIWAISRYWPATRSAYPDVREGARA